MGGTGLGQSRELARTPTRRRCPRGAVSAFTERAVGTDPEGAATWAATIADAKMRATEVERITGKWLRQDKAAAAQWITRNPALDDATKQRLLRGN